MRNFLKTFALLLLMAVCSMGAKAATVSDLVAIDYDYVFVADDVTSNGTVALTAAELYAEDHILAAGWNGNTVHTGKGSSSFAGGSKDETVLFVILEESLESILLLKSINALQFEAVNSSFKLSRNISAARAYSPFLSRICSTVSSF